MQKSTPSPAPSGTRANGRAPRTAANPRNGVRLAAREDAPPRRARKALRASWTVSPDAQALSEALNGSRPGQTPTRSSRTTGARAPTPTRT
jgi:hypothetical protein